MNGQINPEVTQAVEAVVMVTVEATLGVGGIESAGATTISTITTKTMIKAMQTARSTGGIRTGRMGSHHV